VITADQLRVAACKSAIVPFEDTQKIWPQLGPEEQKKWEEMARLVNTHFSIAASFRNQHR
jgi:hypothetical protein